MSDEYLIAMAAVSVGKDADLSEDEKRRITAAMDRALRTSQMAEKLTRSKGGAA